MIYYFVLPRHLESIYEKMNLVENSSIEILVSIAIASIVIAISLLLGEIIRMSASLSHVLLGTK